MLDPTMMYSSAYFERDGMTLEEASIAKLELVCYKLDLGPDDHVLEIGTGWGGFAVYAAAHPRLPRDDDHDLARAARSTPRARVREAGRRDLVTVLADDYRDLRGSTTSSSRSR